MVIVLMGVSGAGKTTVGELLAGKLEWSFYDADDLHPAANREKMRRGAPLSDEDRGPWLAAVRELIENSIANSENVVLACSALKQAYRDEITGDHQEVKLVYLKGAPELMRQRLASRRAHFFNPSLLSSQFATLEEPADAIVEDAARTPTEIADSIVSKLAIISR
jgi:gluconokinase